MSRWLLAMSLLLPAVTAAAPPPDGPEDAEEAAGEEREGGPGMEPGMAHDKGVLAEKFLEKLEKRLELKPEQAAKIRTVIEKSRADLESQRAALRELQKKMHAAAQEMHKAMRRVKESVRDTLDYEQREKFDRMMARQMMRRGQRRRGMGMGMGPGGGRGGMEGPPMKGRRGERPDDDMDDGEDMPPGGGRHPDD